MTKFNNFQGYHLSSPLTVQMWRLHKLLVLRPEIEKETLDVQQVGMWAASLEGLTHWFRTQISRASMEGVKEAETLQTKALEIAAHAICIAEAIECDLLTKNVGVVISPLPDVVDIVQADLTARKRMGTAKYGRPLQPYNGRSALRDAYEEALDMTLYLREKIFEETGQ